MPPTERHEPMKYDSDFSEPVPSLSFKQLPLSFDKSQGEELADFSY